PSRRSGTRSRGGRGSWRASPCEHRIHRCVIGKEVPALTASLLGPALLRALHAEAARENVVDACSGRREAVRDEGGEEVRAIRLDVEVAGEDQRALGGELARPGGGAV